MLLQYRGSKARLAHTIIKFFPPHKVYVEAFGGTGAVLFAKSPCRLEVINDLDSNLVNIYRVLRDEQKCKELERMLEFTPYSRELFMESTEFLVKGGGSDVERAYHYIVASNQSVMGSRRSWLRSRKRNHADRFRFLPEILWEWHRRFRAVVVEHTSWENLLDYYDSRQTLFYLDPPYHPHTCSAYKDYDHRLTRDDHINLIERVQSLKGYTVISGYHHPDYNSLKGWRRIIFEVRNIGRISDYQDFREESLYLSPNIPIDNLFSDIEEDEKDDT